MKREAFVVGISGGSAAGKTTVAALLRQELEPHVAVSVVPVDAYFRDRSTLTPAEQAAVNYDEPAALDFDRLTADLAQLRHGEGVRLPRYDYASHSSYRDGEVLPPAPLVIVEGILLFHPPKLQPLLDYSIFVDAQREERLRRRIARDVAERGRTKAEVIAQFNDNVEPGFDRYIAPTRHKAKTLLDWNRRNPDAIAQIAGLLVHKVLK